MADLETFWATGFWATGLWADNFWAGAPVTPTGNAVVPNTVAHLSQLFVKTVFNDPIIRGPTLRDQQRERAFVATQQQETDDWMAVIAIALHDMEDD